jgi:signal peptidase
MKRAIGLVFAAVALIIAILSVRGSLPFIPIQGSSMEPLLKSGSLLWIDPIDPLDVKVGDIIVYNVPSLIREYYGYPPTVSHRVIEVIITPPVTIPVKTRSPLCRAILKVRSVSRYPISVYRCSSSRARRA